MAVDTRTKRSSAIFPGSPWRCRLPQPDGTIAQGDRQTLGLCYSGIEADAITVDPAPVVRLAVFNDPTRTVEFDERRRLALIVEPERKTVTL